MESMIKPEIDMLNSFTQFSHDIELIGHAETYRSGFNEGYHVLSATIAYIFIVCLYEGLF